MDTQPAFGFNELFTQMIGEMAKAVAGRAGETPRQQFTRTQAAVNAIMAFRPRDAVEAMLAGHCLMFHELIVDSVGDTLRGAADPTRRTQARGTVALDKAFGDNLRRLRGYQRRPAEGRREETDSLGTDRGEAVHRAAEAERGAAVAEVRRAAVERAVEVQRAAEVERAARVGRGAEVARGPEVARAAEVQGAAEVERAAEIERGAEVGRALEFECAADTPRPQAGAERPAVPMLNRAARRAAKQRLRAVQRVGSVLGGNSQPAAAREGPPRFEPQSDIGRRRH